MAPGGLTGTASRVVESPATNSPEILGGWYGLHFGTNGAYSDPYYPPDVQVAAGPTYVVEMVNLLMGVYTKSGTQVGVSSLVNLFNSGSDFVSDPKIQYDAASGRWFATLTDVTLGQVLLATSASADPTGAWRLTSVPSASTGECLDQPILGVGTTTVIVSVNVFTQTKNNPCTTPYLGAQYWVVNKSDLIGGAATPAMYASSIDANEGSIHPAQIEGNSTVHYMVSTYWPGTATTSNTLHLFAVSGTPPAAVTVTVTSLSMPTAALPPPASQLGSKNPIDTADIRVSDAAWAAGRLWLGFDEACLSDSTRSCIRTVEIDTAAGTILQDFDIDVAVKDVFYPAFRVDGLGNFAVVFGYASSSDYPGIMMSARLPADPVNTVQVPSVVVAGTGPESPAGCSATCRYGDYFGAGLDPSDTNVVWLAGELGASAGWSTYIFPSTVKAILTLDYNLRGGGSGYTMPDLTYVSDGIGFTAPLAMAPTTYYADAGSPWSVTPVLTHPYVRGEFWSVDSLNTPPYLGTGDRSSTANYTYFHGYAVRLGYDVHGGSSASTPPPPLVNVTVYGQSSRVSAGQLYVLDAGTNYSYENPLTESTASERIAANGSATGAVTGPLNLTIHYYNQYRVTFDYEVASGGALPAPAVDYSSFGTNASVKANATVWADAGGAYAYSSSLAGNTGGVRVGPENGAVGNITAPGTITVAYRLQYLLNVTVEPGDLRGEVSAGGWYDAGSGATLTATAPSGWKFMGWSGAVTGNGAFLSLTMNQPANVTALFYPGLTIVAGAGGSVAYAYGAVSGTVPAGGSLTVYAPIGTQITLTAQPSSVANAFESWNGGANGSSAATAVTLSAPMTVSAAFGPNLLLVVGVGGGVFLAVLAAVFLLLLARRRRRPPPA